MKLNDWIVAIICAIVSLSVIIGCITDLCYLNKLGKAKKEDKK